LKSNLDAMKLIWNRFLGFLACCGGGIACFGIAFLFLPLRMCSSLLRAQADGLGICSRRET